MRIDARIPVRFVAVPPEQARADQLLLLPHGSTRRPQGWAASVALPAGDPGSPHAAGCACCAARAAQAVTLTGLFQARARGEIGFFRGVVAALPPDQATALRAILGCDPFLSGCFVTAERPHG